MFGRPDDELDVVLSAIDKLRNRLPETSTFGEPIWEKLDRQKELVEHFKKTGQILDHIQEILDDDDVDDRESEMCIEWLEGSDDDDYFPDMVKELG